MKIVAYLLCLLLLVGCVSTGNQSSADNDTVNAKTSTVDSSVRSQPATNITPYKLNVEYTVIDTGVLDATVMGSTYAIVFRNGKLTDTIDNAFGMRQITQDSYLYLTLTGNEPLRIHRNKKGIIEKTLIGSFGNYIINTRGKKQGLANLTQGFDDYFSSPFVINDKIYFWQINRDGNSMAKIFAAEYDPKTGVTKNSYLLEDGVGTDDAGYFLNPYLMKDTIYFDLSEEKKYKFSKDFIRYN